jgi:hypothetical protein
MDPSYCNPVHPSPYFTDDIIVLIAAGAGAVLCGAVGSQVGVAYGGGIASNGTVVFGAAGAAIFGLGAKVLLDRRRLAAGA